MGEIAEGAVIPITRKSYPNTYEAWGERGIVRINALLRPAAEIVASSPGCDRLEVLELSTQRSEPPDKIVFFADCANGKRFYITEGEILAKRQVISENDKSFWLEEQQLIEICRHAITGRLQKTCSFGETTVYRAIAGRTVVTVEFRAENDLGRVSKGVAKCYFEGLSLTDVEFGPGLH